MDSVEREPGAALDSAIPSFGSGNVTAIARRRYWLIIKVVRLHWFSHETRWPLTIDGFPYVVQEELTRAGRSRMFPLARSIRGQGDEIRLAGHYGIDVDSMTEAQFSRLANYVKIVVQATVPAFSHEQYQADPAIGYAMQSDMEARPFLSSKPARRFVLEVMLTIDNDLIVFVDKGIPWPHMQLFLPVTIGPFNAYFTDRRPPTVTQDPLKSMPPLRRRKDMAVPGVLARRKQDGTRCAIQAAPPQELRFHPVPPGTPIAPDAPATSDTIDVDGDQGRRNCSSGSTGQSTMRNGRHRRIPWLSRLSFAGRNRRSYKGTLMAISVVFPPSDEDLLPPQKNRNVSDRFAHLILDDELKVFHWMFMGQQEHNPYRLPSKPAGFGSPVHDESGHNRFAGWYMGYTSHGSWQGFCRVLSSNYLDVLGYEFEQMA